MSEQWEYFIPLEPGQRPFDPPYREPDPIQSPDPPPTPPISCMLCGDPAPNSVSGWENCLVCGGNVCPGCQERSTGDITCTGCQDYTCDRCATELLRLLGTCTFCAEDKVIGLKAEIKKLREWGKFTS